MTPYDRAFFAYVTAGALRSADRVLPLLDPLQIRSVLDVGCGCGAWLSVWQKRGAPRVQGVDGAYVERDGLLIDADRFSPRDLSRPLSLGRRFDLVQSLEVAEHLPPACAAQFVDGLVRHGDLVLFSAAPPGQGGEHHLNERPYQYWRELFARHGYVAIDYLRPLLAGCDAVEPWYRYNSFLYATPERLARLPAAVRAAQVADGTPLADLSPPLYRLRKGLVRWLPVPVMSRLARLKMALRARRLVRKGHRP